MEQLRLQIASLRQFVSHGPFSLEALFMQHHAEWSVFSGV